MPELATSVNTILIGAGFLLIFLELIGGVDTMLDLVLSGFATLVGGVIGFLTLSWWAGLLIAAVIIISYWIFGRRIVRNKFFHAVSSSNADKLPGAKATILSMNGIYGLVKIEGEEWTVESETPIAVGDNVEIVVVNGSILKVKKV